MTALLTRSGDIQGLHLIGPQGVRLGTVRELFIALDTGQTAFLIVETGGLLGSSGKFHPVPWGAVRYDAIAKAFQAEMSKDVFKAAPSYDREQLASADYAWGEQANHYFAGTRPAASL